MSGPRTAWWPATGCTRAVRTASARCCSGCTRTTVAWPAWAWSARSRWRSGSRCLKSCSRWSRALRGTRGTGRRRRPGSARRARPWPAGGTRTRTCRSSRCVPSGCSRSATTTWRARGSGTPPSSSGGGRTVRRGRARTSSWKSQSASTWPRSCAGGHLMAEPKQVFELAGREVAISNRSKVFFARAGITKLDMVRYYLAVSSGALAGVSGRPMALKRFVNGAESEAFFQKRAPDKRPDWIETVELRFPSGRTADEVVVSDEAALAWVVNLGCIDLNPHPVRACDLDHPDELRVDLDPVPGVQWPQIRDVALVAREVLADFGLTGWPKTSGPRGLHVYARIQTR